MDNQDRIGLPQELPLHAQFLNVVSQLLHANGFEVLRPEDSRHDLDVVLGDTTAIVEVKLYRELLGPVDLIKNAISHLLSLNKEKNEKLLLVVSCFVIPKMKEDVLEQSRVIIWDLHSLFALSNKNPELNYQLGTLVSQTFKHSFGEPMTSFKDVEFLIKEFRKPYTTITKKAAIRKGRALCKELNSIETGEGGAKIFEKKCVEILRYLFDNKRDLGLWLEQNRTDDSLNVNDLLCKIISFQNNFWSELSDDFHTRYVVFEFKNYTAKIGQGQILTTEKYLFVTALRSVAFIIARNGADENALKVAKGALKEAGKLLLILSNEDLCQMLDLKDKGDEPSIVLAEKIDKMLVEINR